MGPGGRVEQPPELAGRGGQHPQSQALSPTPPAGRGGQLSNCRKVPKVTHQALTTFSQIFAFYLEVVHTFATCLSLISKVPMLCFCRDSIYPGFSLLFEYCHFKMLILFLVMLKQEPHLPSALA